MAVGMRMPQSQGARRGPLGEMVDAGEGGPTPQGAPRLVLTWPRTMTALAVVVLLLGGRGGELLFLVMALLAWMAARMVAAAADGLAIGYRFLDRYVFLGGEARAEVTVRNRSRWPVPLAILQARFPEGITGQLHRVLTLGPRRMRHLALTVRGGHRGVFRVGDTRIVLADWFGLRQEMAEAPVQARLVVFPALEPVPLFPLRLRLPEGPRRDPVSPFLDELPVGVRPYARGDPLRSIAWKATARRGQLVVRELPPVRETAVWLFLDLAREDWDPLSRHERSELAITVTASLLWQLCQQRRAVGLSVWAAMAEHGLHGTTVVAPGAWIRLPARADERHALTALQVLAGAHLAEGGQFVDRLRQEAGALPWGTQVVALVPRDTPALWQDGAALQARGHPVTVLVFERHLGQPRGVAAGVGPRVLEVRTDDGIAFA